MARAQRIEPDAELVTESHRICAPQKLVRLLPPPLEIGCG
jgi:hypothetical protein